MTKMKQLPDKLSDLLLLAKQEAKIILKTPGYILDMEHWHYDCGDGQCHVCLAGAIIAKHFPSQPTLTLSPNDIEGGQKKLYAVDAFRGFRFKEAIRLFYFSYEKVFEYENEIHKILSTSKNKILLSGIVTSDHLIDEFYNQEAVTRFLKLLQDNDI